MLLFPNAKINLGLRVVEKRPDGFHNIETIFYPVMICDILEFIGTSGTQPLLTISGNIPEGRPEENLVVKAWELMRDEFDIPAVNIHLHKIIPAGAGLGGGSSDAAFMLKGLNDFFHCGCSQDTLKEYALRIGSDCPFFISDIPATGKGRGEVLTPLSLSLANHRMLLKKPDIHINTGEAYAGITPQKHEVPLEDLITRPVGEWQPVIRNDFEKVVFNKFPEIQAVKEELLGMGAEFASMSGSGSAVFGLFTIEKYNKIPEKKRREYFCVEHL